MIYLTVLLVPARQFGFTMARTSPEDVTTTKNQQKESRNITSFLYTYLNETILHVLCL